MVQMNWPEKHMYQVITYKWANSQHYNIMNFKFMGKFSTELTP